MLFVFPTGCLKAGPFRPLHKFAKVCPSLYREEKNILIISDWESTLKSAQTNLTNMTLSDFSFLHIFTSVLFQKLKVFFFSFITLQKLYHSFLKMLRKLKF